MHAKAVAALVAVAGAAIAAAAVVARAAQAVDVADADLARASRGLTVRVGSPSHGRETTSIPLEVYVAQVLAAEGEPNAPDAAEQALAVAARTYALFNGGRHAKDGYDVCDTTHCQVLRASSAATRRAAQATAGLVLTYQGAPADLYYSASCGGRTERASDVWPKVSLPYLDSVEDDVHEDDPSWTFERTLDDLRDALARAGARGRRLEDVVIESRTGSGRVGRVGLPGLEPASMNSNDFRLAVGSTELRSTAFTVARAGDRVTFTGKGYGHGVGMCVVGAGRRALRGESAQSILARYYPGLALEDVSRVMRNVAPRQAANVPPVLPPPKATAPPPVPPVSATAAKPPSVQGFVAAGSGVSAPDLERLTAQAETRVASRLGVAPVPLSVRLHASIEGFRYATGQPWWVSAAVRGSEIDLAPAALLDQRDGLEAALARAVAQALMAPSLRDRPAWVRVGGARYFTRAAGAVPEGRVRCPDDAELTAAVSAATQREAEARAEACFAQALAKTDNWRAIR
jgi:stage II sporulation protein D